jgi:hypothetical protein
MLEVNVMRAIQLAMLCAKAALEAINATTALLDVDPSDAKAIQQLQNVVHRYRDMIDWLGTAVEDGNNAYIELNEEERHELLAALNLENDA